LKTSLEISTEISEKFPFFLREISLEENHFLEALEARKYAQESYFREFFQLKVTWRFLRILFQRTLSEEFQKFLGTFEYFSD